MTNDLLYVYSVCCIGIIILLTKVYNLYIMWINKNKNNNDYITWVLHSYLDTIDT